MGMGMNGMGNKWNEKRTESVWNQKKEREENELL